LSKLVFMLVALAVAGSWPVPVHAQSPEAMAGIMMMGDGPVLVIPLLLRFADLTTQQTDQAHRIIETDSIDAQKFLSQLAEVNSQLDDALLAPGNMPARNLSVIVQRLAQLRLEFMQSELKTVLAIRKILTPEQLGKVTAAMDEMKNTGTSQLEPHSRTF
jgi:Spy/CpxP family protein refolding chaperone